MSIKSPMWYAGLSDPRAYTEHIDIKDFVTPVTFEREVAAGNRNEILGKQIEQNTKLRNILAKDLKDKYLTDDAKCFNIEVFLTCEKLVPEELNPVSRINLIINHYATIAHVVNKAAHKSKGE